MSGRQEQGNRRTSKEQLLLLLLIPTSLCPEMLFTKDKQQSCLSTIPLVLPLCLFSLTPVFSINSSFLLAVPTKDYRDQAEGKKRNQPLEQCAPISSNSPDVRLIVQQDVIACTQATHVTKAWNSPHEQLSHQGRADRTMCPHSCEHRSCEVSESLYRAASSFLTLPCPCYAQ